MPKEQHEALDECNLDQNVSQADRDEVDQGKRWVTGAAATQHERQNEKYQHGNERDYQHQKKNQHAEIHLPVDSLSQTPLAQNLPGFEREKEKWCVIAHGRN